MIRSTTMAGIAAVLAWLLTACGGSSGNPDGSVPDGGCGTGLTECAGSCVDTGSDPDHCGACEHACDPGWVCAQGSCMDECPAGLTDCDGSCVDLLSSPFHCGACGTRCERPGAEGDCLAGDCGSWRCLPGFVDVDGDLSNGCEESCAPREIHVAGALDYDLATIHVAGRVTVNGADPGPAGGAGSRGHLVFRPAGGGKPVTRDLGRTGPAGYRVYLLATTYTIELENSSDCPDGPFPCGTTTLRQGVALTADGSLDLDVTHLPPETFEVTGAVTVNGAAMPAGTGGQDRGRIVFRSDTGVTAEDDLGRSGPASYRVTLSPGTYEVAIENPDDCPDGVLPCRPKRVREALSLQGPGNLDVDLTVVDVTGVVTVNGAPAGPSATGTARGLLAFDDGEGTVETGLGTSGPASYEVRLYAGSYDIGVANTTDCPATDLPPLPCQDRTLRRALPLTGDGALDLDVEAVTVSGTASINGGAMPASTSGAQRGSLLFLDDDGYVPVPLGTSGPATYRVRLHAGTYAVGIDNRDDCPPDEPGALPCGPYDIREAIPLLADGAADFDLPVITVSGTLTVNGEPVPAGSASRGELKFTHTGGFREARFDAGPTGEVAYRVALYPGRYEAGFDNRACRDDAVPCQAMVIRSVELTGDGALDLDLPVVAITGRVTRNQGTIPDGAGVESRGLLLFEEQSAGAVAFDIGSRGEVLYEVELFAGTYTVSFENTEDCPDGALPCLGTMLRQGLALATDGALDLDLQVVPLSGQVTVDGATMADSVSGARRAVLRFVSAATGHTLEADLGTTGPAIYEEELFPGAYSVLFEGTDCPDDPDGAVPCEGMLLEGCGQ